MKGLGIGLIGVLLAAIVLLFVPLVLWSFSERWFFPDLFPQAWGLRAWHYLFDTAGSQMARSLFQSLGLSVTVAAISVAVGYPAGRVLGMYTFPGKNYFAVLLILPVIVPPLCVAMGLQLWFLRLGLAETFVGVVLVHLTTCLPYAVYVMWGVFTQYNPEFEGQARTLGASIWSVVTKVMLPMTSTGVMVAFVFCFLLSWSQYVSTLIIGGGRFITLPIMLFALMGSGDRPVAAAVSIVFVLPALAALLISARTLGRRSMTGIW